MEMIYWNLIANQNGTTSFNFTCYWDNLNLIKRLLMRITMGANVQSSIDNLNLIKF
jgi:hypothetical protein